MQKIFGVGLLAGVVAAGIYLKSCWPPDETQLAIQAKQAEIQLVQEQQKLVKMKVQAQADLLKIQNDSKIENAPQVMKARIATRTLTALWLPLSLLTAASVGAGFLIYTTIKPRSFRYGKLKTVVSRKQAAALATRSLYVSGMSKAAKIAAFREEIGAARFARDVSLFSALKHALRGRESVTPQASLPEAHVDDPARVSLPSFSEILESREIHGELILGYTQDSEPITDGFDAVHSCLVYGLAKSGKTTWLRALYAQTIKVEPETQVFALDPHRRRKDSLVGSLPSLKNLHVMNEDNPTDDFAVIENELKRRLASEQEHFPPFIFLVDELPTLMKESYAKHLKDVCERIAQQGRKVCVYLLVSAQDLREKKIGDFRASLSSAYFFKGKASQVKAFLGNDSEAEKQFRQIHGPGMALFSSTHDEPRLVAIPECKPSDLTFLTHFNRVNDDTVTSERHADHPSNVVNLQEVRERLNSPEHKPEQCSEYSEQCSEQASIKKRMNSLNVSLNGLSKLAGVPKSSLSVYLNGGKLSEEYKHAIQETLSVLQKQAGVSA